jgi:two-component system cell cycle sensor histidine kinase/response regulator CckA
VKILIVDDSSDDRKVLRYLIAQQGHTAIEAEDGEAGLRIAKETDPDLIISDALMPVMDGFQFLREVKNEPLLRSKPFIFYSSSYKEYQDVRLAMSLGADAYIIKPVEPLELWAKIEELLGADRKGKSSPVPLIKEDAEYLKRYSQVVAAKLEKKVQELERSLEERKLAEDSLKDRDAFIRDILESVDEGFIVVDQEYRILSANRAYCAQVNRQQADVVGKYCYEVSHHVDKPCFTRGELCAVKQCFVTKTPHAVTHTHTKSTGEQQYVEIKAYPMFDAAGEVVSAIETVNDITEQKKLEDQLRQAQKMEAIGTLAGGVAHDFNNILTAIIGYGNIVKMKLPAADPLQASVNQILLSSDRAAHLTHGLLAFSRKQVINPKPVDLNDIVKNVEKLLRRLIGEDVDLSVNLAADALIIMADSGQIEQTLMNLATNARDAMPEGGRLVIATGESAPPEEVTVAGRADTGKYALITVADTGTGMDEKIREKIFEPFFTTKEQGKGTGLGLSIVYGIVKQHNGYITVASEPGAGTSFSLYFPLVAADVEIHGAETATLRGGTETILIAEDDPDVRNMASQLLADFGYRVIEATDGQQAIDKFVDHLQEIDLLLLDVIMPKKSGKEVYVAIKSLKPDAAVLFMSGYTADILTRKGVIAEDSEFLMKPVSPPVLLRKIRETLDKRKK